MKRVALVVGVDEYRDPDILSLEFAVQDAMDLAGWLQHVAGYHVQMLAGIHAQANKVQEAVLDSVAGLGPEDLFLFYFAGHGYHHLGQHLLLCPEARLDGLDFFQNTVPVDLLKRRTHRQGLRRAFVLDACRRPLRKARGGGAAVRGTQIVRDILAEYRPPGGGGLAVLCSCADEQQALEVTGLRHGLFSFALLEELKAARAVGRQVRVDDDFRLALQGRMKDLALRHGQPSDQEPQSDCRGEVPVLLPALKVAAPGPIEPAPRRGAEAATPLRIASPSSTGPDPAEVEVKEVTIEPLKIEVEQVAKEQVEAPGLPPIPPDILELEGRLAGLEEASRRLEDGTHPSLAPAQQAVREMQQQWDALAKDLEANTPSLPRQNRHRLQAEALKTPLVSVVQLCALAPSAPTAVVLPYIQRLRNVERARVAFERARRDYEAARQRELGRLQEEVAAVLPGVKQWKEEDLTAALTGFFDRVGDSPEFPLDAWNAFEPVLLRRRYPWTDRETLQRAERFFEERRDQKAWKAVLTERTQGAVEFYLLHWPLGLHRTEAELLLADLKEESAWARAESSRAQGDLEAFLKEYPSGRHAPQARALLAQLQEDAAWSPIANSNDAAQLEAFQRAYPEGRHAAEAARRLAELQRQAQSEAEAQFEAERRQTRRRTKALLVGLAVLVVVLAIVAGWVNRLRNERVRELGDWNKAVAVRTEPAFGQYLTSWPDGRHASEANAAIKRLQEEDDRDWKLALEVPLANRIPALRAYVDKRPDGRYAVEARDQIRIIEVEVEDGREQDDRDWKEAQAANTIPGYQAYLDKWKRGRHREEAQGRIRLRQENQQDDRDWESARTTNTIPAFQTYLNNWREGRHANEARTEIARLRQEDERDWKEAAAANTIAAFRAYLDKQPNGGHLVEAKSEIERLQNEEDADWKRAQTANTIAAYGDYLSKWPNDGHTNEARTAIQALNQRDDDHWRRAQSGETTLSLEDYLTSWPRGRHRQEAEERLARIRSLIDKAWVNSLGMKFVSLPDTNVLVCIWETRVRDYAAYAQANRAINGAWRDPMWRGVPVSPTQDCPVVNVSWTEARDFCLWLTRKERRAGLLKGPREYRLLTDAEWSAAAGLVEPAGLPHEKHCQVKDLYPWGSGWPPPDRAGNYADEPVGRQMPDVEVIKGYDDGYVTTSPAGLFGANRLGLHDLGGNAWEWCEDGFGLGEVNCRTLRGASWLNNIPTSLLLSYRNNFPPDTREPTIGFRIVLDSSGRRR